MQRLFKKCRACGDPSVEEPALYCSPECSREAAEPIDDAHWQLKFMTEHRYKSTGVPPLYDAPWRDDLCPEAPKLRASAERFIQDFKELPIGIYCSGHTGVGKSRFAALVAWHAARAGISCRWFEMPEFFERLRGTMNPRAEETEHDVLEDLLAPQLAILDDLGAERCSEWVMEKLYMVLNGRYKRMKKVIITSNLSLSELKSYWSAVPACAPAAERLISRIAGMCYTLDRFGRQDLRNR